MQNIGILAILVNLFLVYEKKKRKEERKKDEEAHFCGECAHGVWVNKPNQKDVQKGLPLIVRCPFEQWARIRSEQACEHFEMKQNGIIAV